MPLIAVGLGGALDATQDDLGNGLSWSAVYRVRPRVRLVCRACDGVLHAKVSQRGLRFFAHDNAERQCPLNGETLEHRLLKSAVAAAVRLAGWHAALEVSAPDGAWRADVLATSPDGARRVAWEVQLAHQHHDDAAARTARYADGGIEVVWVFTHVAAATVPHVVIEADGTELTVSGPMARFHATYCDGGQRCVRFHELADPPACAGHGTWQPVTLALGRFVALSCHDAVVWSGARTAARSDPQMPEPAPAHAWTSPYYLRQAGAIEAANRALDERFASERDRLRQRRESDLRRRREEAERRAANREALRRRQELLTPVATLAVESATGERPWPLPGDHEHGMGVSIVSGGRVRAVVCPIASRITDEVAERLAGLTVYVASDQERAAVARRCRPGQQIAVLSPQ